MIYHKTACKTMTFLAVMLMIFCIGGWLTGLATIGNDAMRNDPKVDSRIVDAFDGDEMVSVIVILKDSETLEGRRNIQSDVLSNAPGFEMGYNYMTVNGFSGKIDKYTLNTIRFNENVEAIYFNGILSINLNDSAPLINGDYITNTEFKNVYLKGKNQGVCVIDTGVNYNHPALSGRVVQGPDYYNGDSAPMDDNSHGTHVAGIIASNDTTYTGIAPEANIVAIKVCDSSGLVCPVSNITAGIDWCINHSSQYNISVISMSLGDDGEYTSSNCYTYGIDSFVNNAVANGIFVVSSSGNNYHNNGISSPACIANVTSVNAVNKQGSIWDRGNTGEALDLLAPGVSIVSSVLGTGFDDKTGTSQAAPHVAGTAVLLYQHANLSGETITPDEVKARLIDNGINITDPDNNITVPKIDVKNSVLSGRLALGDLASPYPKSNADMEFYANYTNRTDGAAISDGNCSISFSDVTADMAYNSSRGIYTYTRNFTSPSIYSYNITCNSSDFETLIELSSVDVVQGSENCTYSGSNGIWNITLENGSFCIGENLILNQSNISIEPGAEFVLNDSNITLVGASTRYIINISDNANFALKNAIVKGTNPSTSRLDIELYGDGSIINSTFENSRLTTHGSGKNIIEKSTFKSNAYFNDNSENNISISNFTSTVYFQDSSINKINGSVFSGRVYSGDLGTNDDCKNHISNSSFNGDYFVAAGNSIANFSGIVSNITAELYADDNPVIYGAVNMPNTTTMLSDNLTRFYPVHVYYNDGTTPYPSKAVILKDSNGSTLFEGTTDSNGFVEINLTLNTTNYGIGNFSVEVNPTENVGLLTDTPITLDSSDDAPDGGSPGGGGPSGSSDDECVQEWNCTEWGECVYGYQTRICSDMNDCENETGKPSEIQECGEVEDMPRLVDDVDKDGIEGDILHVHGNDEEGNAKDCCLWRICGARWLGLCWYVWFVIGLLIVITFIIWWSHLKRKKRKKMQKALVDAFGVDWTLKHLHLK